MQQLYHQIYILQQQLAQCMDRLGKIEQKLDDESNEQRSPSTIHIEKIEYKFDQLKVETLEGTLSIGLSPTELAKHNVEIPCCDTADPTYEQTRQFIENQIPTIFAGHSSIVDPSGQPITKEQLTEQLIQQLPHRTEQLQANHKGPAPISNEQLTALLHRDVAHALHALRAQQPKSGEEGSH